MALHIVGFVSLPLYTMLYSHFVRLSVCHSILDQYPAIPRKRHKIRKSQNSVEEIHSAGTISNIKTSYSTQLKYVT